MPAVVERLEYDPNRTAFIALIRYDDGELSYILAPQRLAVGDNVVAGRQADVKPGNAMPLQAMPVGTIVHNVEMKPGKGGQIARSAGTYAQYVGRDAGYAILRLNSGEQRLVHQNCLATVGAVSNPDHGNISIGKAGRNRWLGKKPSVRGVAMNPVDHPHGGGEGRTSGGRHPVTPWGKPTKGKKTRNNKRTDKFIARSRHARKVVIGDADRGSFSLERPLRRRLCSAQGREGARRRPQRNHQDLEPALDDPAAVRRPDLRRLQRPEACSGAASARTWSATSSASSRRPGPSTATPATRRRRGPDHEQGETRAGAQGQRSPAPGPA